VQIEAVGTQNRKNFTTPNKLRNGQMTGIYLRLNAVSAALLNTHHAKKIKEPFGLIEDVEKHRQKKLFT